MENNKIPDPHPEEISREELGHIAYMCYVLNRTETTRWYHKWSSFLELMTNQGWTWDGLHYRGLIRQKLEYIYGLNTYDSRTAIKAFPLVNMGLQPWEILTEGSANELAEKIFRSYVGLPPEHGRGFLTASPCNGDGDDQNDDYDSDNVDMSFTDDEEDTGGFFFL